ncbi:hypothetical protein LSTR_LSTR001770 [Laodelphax striatellus]|uniref:Protein krueppel n=1 Tax=Laodelphax striatellus TaxID=195883 RepID=A0A482WGG1_LAOST|nr:hypothetical protein LSTR_LSTR001770 [Laodelphax striatellus]
MSGYKRVNYYELCRLCTSSEGNKVHIFREEGRKRQIPTKIQECLSLPLSENDSLPKNICTQCEEKLESFNSFKEACLDAGKMLTTFFSTIRFSDDFLKNGLVYIRDTSQNESKEKSSEAEDHPPPVDACSDSGRTTIINQSQSPDVNHVTSTTSKVAAATKKQVMGTTQNNYTFREQIEAQNVSLPSQVVVMNSNYVGFNNGNLMNGNVKRESPLNNNHMMNSSHNKSPNIFQSSTEMPLKETNESADQNLFYSKKKKKKTLVEMAGSNMGDAPQQEVTYQHNQEFRLQLGLANEVKESDGNFTTENAENRTSETQIGEFSFFKLKTEASMDGSMGEENGDSSMQLPDCEMSDREYGSNEELTGHMVGYEGEAGVDSGNPGSESSSNKRKADVFCEICNKGFRRKEHLHQHMKLHTGERPYNCSTCNKKFSRKEHLIRHSVSHTGEKCHPCDICGKTFSRKDNLHKHKKTHGVTGPYVCEECGKSFLIKHYYLLHQSIHNAAADHPNLFKCDICDKVFATKQYLRSHKVRHERKARKNDTKESAPSTAEQSATETTPPLQLNPSEPSPLTTINAQAILPSNLLQVAAPPLSTNVASISTPNPVFQVCNMSGKQTFVMSVASKQLLETFRKLNS